MKSPEQRLFTVHYDQHAELLKAVMPASRQTEVTEAWVADLNELLIECDVMRSSQSTRGGRAHTRELRACFEEKMHAGEPDSALYATYKKTQRSYGSAGPHPCNVIGNLIGLVEIGGSIENGLQMLQKGNNMLIGTPESLLLAHSHIQHLAYLTGWEGNVRQLLLDLPNLLRMGLERRAFIGRMAMTYGSPWMRQMDSADIKRRFLVNSVDDYMIALITQWEDYCFEATPQVTVRMHARRSWIYQKLEKPEVVAHIGPRILRAYFRYYRPTSHSIRRYPHLAALLGEPPPKDLVD